MTFMPFSNLGGNVALIALDAALSPLLHPCRLLPIGLPASGMAAEIALPATLAAVEATCSPNLATFAPVFFIHWSAF
jgi:hypothetical protein